MRCFANPPYTLPGVRRRSNGVEWRDGPICQEQPNPPVPRAPS